MSAVQQAGVIGLGKAFAPVLPCPRSRRVRQISRARPETLGLVAISAATETRLLPCAVTVTTGVRPRRPLVRPFGGLSSWPDSSSEQSQAPRSAAVFITSQVSSRQAAIAASSRSAARRARTWTLHSIRCSRISSPASVYSTWNRLCTSSPIRASVQH